MRLIRPCVVGIGELVWDRFAPHAKMPGGAPANFVFHAQQLGADGVIVTAVGRDAAGDELLAWLDGRGLRRSGVQHNDRPTGSVDVTVDDAGQPSYIIHRDVAWDELEWTPALDALSRQADCVHVGSLAQRSPRSRQTIQRFLTSVRTDCLRVFDVNLRPPHDDLDVVEQTLAATDLIKLNEHEWPALADHLRLDADWRAGVPQLLARTRVRSVALTCGASGSAVVDRDGPHELPAAPVTVADTIGAGDSFTAALAMGVLRRLPLHEAHAAASRIAAYVCTQPGATPILPDELTEGLRGAEAYVANSKVRAMSPKASMNLPSGIASLDDAGVTADPTSTR